MGCKKKILTGVFSLAIIATLAGCGSKATTAKPSDTTKKVVTTTKKTESKTTVAKKTTQKATTANQDSQELKSYKDKALEKLDELVNPVIEKITDDDLKKEIKKYYDQEKSYVNGITDLATAKNAGQKVIDDTKAFAKDTLLPYGVNKLDTVFLPVINKIPDGEIKTNTLAFYNTEKEKLANVDSLDEASNLVQTVLKDVKEYVEEQVSKVLDDLKDAALSELDTYVSTLINKISNEELKADTQELYTTEKEKLNDVKSIDDIDSVVKEIKDDVMQFVFTKSLFLATNELSQFVAELISKIPDDDLKDTVRTFFVDEVNKLNDAKTIDDIETTVAEIKEDTEKFVFDETKKFIIAKLDKVVEAGLAKLHNDDLKKELNDFYDGEKVEINKINSLDDIEDVIDDIIEDTEEFIKSLVAKTLKEYLKELFTYSKANPYDLIPDAMHPNYSSNLVNSVVSDFTTEVVVASIKQQGFGEQWQMVVSNINQMLTIVSGMNVVSDIMTTVSSAMNIYIENSAAETLEKSISNDSYTANLSFKDGYFYLEVIIKEEKTLPGIGTVTPVIKMGLDISTGNKATYIALNDSNIVKYTTGTNLFELALTYGATVAGKEVSKSSYFSTTKDKSGNVSGHIYEYITYEESDKIKACADFYVKDGYVSVVGNKASGMVGFTGYITELYGVNDGRLLGYKVQEEVSGVSYNTLWFNIWDIDGINAIKVTDKTKDNESGKSTVDVYLNGSSTLFAPTYNKKLGVKTSRKYDIELRSRYYYSMVDGNLVCTEVLVPMMFIQDDNSVDTNYSDFNSNMAADNSINAKVLMSDTVLSTIRSDYNTLIPVFKENKENMSSEEIISYLNSFNE